MGKITIIGTGNVGATIANNIVTMGLAGEVLLVDIDKEKSYGEAMDIYQGVSFCAPAIVRSGDFEDAAGSDIVIITSGIGRKPGQTRLELAQTNVNILKQITPQIVKAAPDAKYVIVSNPVDILTYVFTKISGVPESHIIGSGTVLDTARLQAELAKKMSISPKNVHAHVYGEHGDSSFVPWSLATIANNHIDEYPDHSPDKAKINWNSEEDKLKMEEFVRTSGGKIIKAKRATFYAVAISVCHLIKCLKNDAGTAVTVSTMMHGEYGVDDICLSTLAMLDENGVRGKIMNTLTDEEVVRMQNSAEKLRAVLSQIEL
ncbi:MAG: L-lactate dehydrogenase [Eubacteriales bacterium]